MFNGSAFLPNDDDDDDLIANNDPCACGEDTGLNSIDIRYEGDTMAQSIMISNERFGQVTTPCIFANIEPGATLTCEGITGFGPKTLVDVITYDKVNEELWRGARLRTSCRSNLIGKTARNCKSIRLVGWIDETNRQCDTSSITKPGTITYNNAFINLDQVESTGNAFQTFGEMTVSMKLVMIFMAIGLLFGVMSVTCLCFVGYHEHKSLQEGMGTILSRNMKHRLSRILSKDVSDDDDEEEIRKIRGGGAMRRSDTLKLKAVREDVDSDADLFTNITPSGAVSSMFPISPSQTHGTGHTHIWVNRDNDAYAVQRQITADSTAVHPDSSSAVHRQTTDSMPSMAVQRHISAQGYVTTAALQRGTTESMTRHNFDTKSMQSVTSPKPQFRRPDHWLQCPVSPSSVQRNRDLLYEAANLFSESSSDTDYDDID